MKKTIWIFVLITLLIAIPVQAHDSAQLSDKFAELEETAANLQLIVAGTTPIIDPTIVHRLNEAVSTTIGLLQITEAFVTTDGVLRISFKLLNTTDEPVLFEASGVTVRDATGKKLDSSWDCPNRLNGMLIPGDRMQGNACVEFAGPLPLRVYYAIYGYEADFVSWKISE